MTTAVIIKGRVSQTFKVRAELAGAPVDLTAVELQVRLATATGLTGVDLAASAVSPQSGSSLGRFTYAITAADMAAIGDPTTALVVINLWNADGSLLMRAPTVMNVVL